ncbi:histidine phosphatase family protein [Paenibacillus vulneris]|uniref:Histidine phosphatase family protein n=1 Tax=Paenibacillus vulneris TaxID=1133364 RepID=A0ABW3UWG7_9BACL|nr:histidine phosphatase family protein [Paenibacillus sp. 32352]
MAVFYLVRHGEPDWGLKEEKQLQGAMRDFVPLTATGVLQAEKVMNCHPYLRECDLILSSPYTRALQTAAIMNRTLGKPLQVEFDLYEWTPDQWEAASADEIHELWKDYMLHDGCWPEGETRLWETKASLWSRINGVLARYESYSNVVVVCHGMVISTLLGLASTEIELCGVYEYCHSRMP